MKKTISQKKFTRRHLADPQLGLSYSERLSKAGYKAKKGEFKIVDCGNGYAILEKRG